MTVDLFGLIEHGYTFRLFVIIILSSKLCIWIPIVMQRGENESKHPRAK